MQKQPLPGRSTFFFFFALAMPPPDHVTRFLSSTTQQSNTSHRSAHSTQPYDSARMSHKMRSQTRTVSSKPPSTHGPRTFCALCASRDDTGYLVGYRNFNDVRERTNRTSPNSCSFPHTNFHPPQPFLLLNFSLSSASRTLTPNTSQYFLRLVDSFLYPAQNRTRGLSSRHFYRF